MAGKKALLTVGQVAEAVGVPSSTLRYYEREGIFTPSNRNGAGYRLYEPQAVERLQFIRSAQAVGFTLEDIRALLDLDQHDPKSCKTGVQRLLHERLGEVEAKMKELKRVREALRRALDKCRDSTGECPVLIELSTPKKRRR
ncbi:Mercuric resistance operon regulatory protein [Phycisphaerae bacterium RAS2]|nr:Mercuric resistance operon regulatory protein [Phycisphaerae bacterium RAS2]